MVLRVGGSYPKGQDNCRTSAPARGSPSDARVRVQTFDPGKWNNERKFDKKTKRRAKRRKKHPIIVWLQRRYRAHKTKCKSAEDDTESSSLSLSELRSVIMEVAAAQKLKDARESLRKNADLKTKILDPGIAQAHKYPERDRSVKDGFKAKRSRLSQGIQMG